tara:strand:- start:3347 stop:5215 length:1869 start_codon:yes stop_codon:yes gene_type:complete
MNIHNVTINKDIKIQMRDGVNLYTDIYFPSDENHKPIYDLPILLERTPYDKKALNLTQRYNHFCQNGYIVITQDCRGCYASEGELYFLTQEAEDGADTLDWIGKQNWFNGPVGTFGTSYQAWTQSAAATQNPKFLNAMIVNMGGSNAFTSTVRQSGAMELRFIAWAFWHSALNTNKDLKNIETDFALNNYSFENLLNNWPIKKGLTPLSLVPSYEKWAFDILTKTKYDEFWKHPGFAIDEYWNEHPDIPMIYVGGWYDSYTRATLENYDGLSKLKNSEVKVIIGPWTHGTTQPELTYSGDLEFGKEASIGSFSDFHLAWYNKWFKNNSESDYLYKNPIKLFVMGSGDGHKTKEGRIFHGGFWREEQEWPLKRSKFTKFYLDSNNNLSSTQSSNSNESITFAYDPSNPVPTIGANISSLAGLRPIDSKVRSPHEVPAAARRYNIVEPGGFNQKQEKRFYGTKEPYSNLSERLDVLTFQSELLSKDTEITGPIEATLYVSSDCVDTDFTVKLIDVYPSTKDFPDGFSLNLTDGIIRMRYRNSFTKEEFMKENEVYKVKIILYPTSNIFKKGHRIRVDVSSSNYPKFDFNPNTGEPIGLNKQQTVANNSVHFSEKYPSHITLPIV